MIHIHIIQIIPNHRQYPLVNVYITIEHHHDFFMGKSTCSIYYYGHVQQQTVTLPEGNRLKSVVPCRPGVFNLDHRWFLSRAVARWDHLVPNINKESPANDNIAIENDPAIDWLYLFMMVYHGLPRYFLMFLLIYLFF